MNKIRKKENAFKAKEDNLYNYKKLSNELKNDPGLLVCSLLQINTLNDYTAELQMLRENVGDSLQHYLKSLNGKHDSHISKVYEASMEIVRFEKTDLSLMSPFRGVHISIPSENIDVFHPAGKVKKYIKEQL